MLPDIRREALDLTKGLMYRAQYQPVAAVVLGEGSDVPAVPKTDLVI
jgi:hypothetical protein